MLSITRSFRFEAAHRLCLPHLTTEENQTIFGPCARIHGHSYRLEVTLAGVPDIHGWIMNFSELKEIVHRHVLSEYDHACLNEVPDYKAQLPTAENMAKTIFFRLKPHLEGSHFHLLRICLYETENAWATWEADHAPCP